MWRAQGEADLCAWSFFWFVEIYGPASVVRDNNPSILHFASGGSVWPE
jgi:hypothetical protein